MSRASRNCAWVLPAVFVTATAITGCASSPDTATATAAPTTASSPSGPATSPTRTTPTATATATVSLAEWREEHGGNIALVIATANGLVTAIDGSSESQITVSCDALTNNYRKLLQPIPDPPGPLGETSGPWDQAKDAIYNAQRECQGGIIRKADLYTARSDATDGIALLNEVLG